MTTSNKNPGNFANDREKASEAGRKGGQGSGGNFRSRESLGGRQKRRPEQPRWWSKISVTLQHYSLISRGFLSWIATFHTTGTQRPGKLRKALLAVVLNISKCRFSTSRWRPVDLEYIDKSMKSAPPRGTQNGDAALPCSSTTAAMMAVALLPTMWAVIRD